ncbi:MAG: hypothetical protein WD034_01055 [Parvibaculum sp.]|uniref:hypothetical protein n=1 Tax=Parvibaculum sp. TaxID=2024848 RepID=UPI0034A00CFB
MSRGRNVSLHFLKLAQRAALPVAAAFLLSGCLTSGEDSKPVAAAPEPAPAPVAMAAEDAVLAALESGIPLPLPSPLHRGPVQVASIDPSAGLSSLTTAPRLGDFAGVYVNYGSALAAASEARLNTPSDVRRALERLRFAEPDGLAEGWYAARAMIAAQDPEFAQGVRNEARAVGKTVLLEQLTADEDYVLQIRGSSSASTAVAGAIREETTRMAQLSARFIDTAYQFQKQKWGMIAPQPARPETPVKAAAASPLERARAVLAALSPVGTAHAYTPSVMNRILTLAAHQVLDGSTQAVQTSAPRNPTGRCLNWARLNLDQCLAAARFPSEEAWCAGKHAVEEVSGCWAEALPATPAAN